MNLRKPTKTISGVTPLTVVLGPKKCDHGTCLYCPGGKNVPQSYTDKSPAVMRGLKLKFDPFKQVKVRLEVLEKMGHPTDKIELIIIGGTFLQYSREYKYEYVKACYDALNGKKSKTLEEAKILNQSAIHRCVAFCIENRPDNCSERDIREMLDFGCTRVELGVQILSDRIYQLVNRGHTVQEVIDATKRLKDAGFKIGYHIMPGLPGSNLENDLRLFKIVFSDSRFKPDQLKLYPCQVIEGSPLEKLYWKGDFIPYTREQTEEILKKMLVEVPRYCRVMRMMREIPAEYTVAGTIKIDMRRDMEKELREQFREVKEIRFREIGFALRDGRKVDTNLKLKIIKYSASEGDEYFLEIVNNQDVLFGLLRLRIFGEEDKKKAIIRELHVYGKAIELGEESEIAQQHKGLGKWLMSSAEEICRREDISILKIISGVGVREYYGKLGYSLDSEGIYMEKEF